MDVLQAWNQVMGAHPPGDEEAFLDAADATQRKRAMQGTDGRFAEALRREFYREALGNDYEQILADQFKARCRANPGLMDEIWGTR